VGRQADERDFALFGQEMNGTTHALCRMNMFLHGMDNFRIEWGDTLRNPRLVEGDQLLKFDIVVANPPFSLDKWGYDEAAATTPSTATTAVCRPSRRATSPSSPT
jgi:type I restriction enzyme M protein